MHFLRLITVATLICAFVAHAGDPSASSSSSTKRFLQIPSAPSKRPKLAATPIDPLQGKEIVKVKIGQEERHVYVDALLGHGGSYAHVENAASSTNKVESDHAPPFNLISFLNKDFRSIEELPEAVRTAVKKHLKNRDFLSVPTWDKKLQDQYNANVQKIAVLEKEISALDGSTAGKSEKKNEVAALLSNNMELRREAEVRFVEKVLSKYKKKFKNGMAALSIPFQQHRRFPTTTKRGYGAEIDALKNKGVEDTKLVVEKYSKQWKEEMDIGINKGYFKNADDFAKKTGNGEFVMKNGKKVYDYQKLWESNFPSILNSAFSKGTGETETFMKALHKTYSQKFIATSILYVKEPGKGFQLMDLYISEYKLYLGELDSYKPGLLGQLEANKKFGFVTDDDIAKLRGKYQLDQVPSRLPEIENQWNEVQKRIIDSRGRSDKKASKVEELSCSELSSRRRKRRSAAGGGANGCIFLTKQRHASSGDDDDFRKGNNKADVDADGMPRSRISLPLDSDLKRIDSKQLNTFLTTPKVDDGDIDSVKVKESVVDSARRNPDKLTGTPEDIAKTSALLKRDTLEAHSQQNDLARKVLRNPGGVTASDLSRYQKVKVSTTKFAAKTQKLTSGSGHVANAYGKIMLAKGVTSAIRHGDYESLALIGGRIGLEFALEGVTRVGRQLAKKATSKFVTKLGANVLGKMAGPVGDLADIGISVYSITKSVKVLNNPNASKFEQNEAIADIVADSIDIAVTASAAVLSLVFPPLAPVFAAVAFVVNILSTVALAFFKAANHVDMLNEKLPLLDFERRTEYWRYMGGKNTSGYIQELIDTKRANNINVNATLQFLSNNPDYIGRVFPSTTMCNPEANKYSLQEKVCVKALHLFSIGCDDWRDISECEGYGQNCEGEYSDWKCESRSASKYIFGGHKNIEYRCQCGTDQPPAGGYEVLDNVVDFSQRRNVYLKRAAPDQLFTLLFLIFTPDAKYLCKPSSLHDEGEKVSERHTSYEYLCKDAIGIQSNGNGKFMLYDLGRGTDAVYLAESDTVDNLFVVKDGHKTFNGNGGDDTFYFAGPCGSSLSGLFNGGGYREHGNSLVLDTNCAQSMDIVVDLKSGRLNFSTLSSISRMLAWAFPNSGFENQAEIKSIHRVVGRKEGTDQVITGCDTKSVVGGGGRTDQSPDVITLTPCNGDGFELILRVEGSTFLNATSFSGGKVVTLIRGQVSFLAWIPETFGGTLLFKFENVGSLTSAHVEVGALILEFGNGGFCRFEFDGHRLRRPSQSNDACTEAPKQEGSQITLLINGSDQFSRQIIPNLAQGQVQCFYRLESGATGVGRIRGYSFMDNIFHLISGRWHVIGGNFSNQFILISSAFGGSIDGGSGRKGSLHFGDQVTEPLEIDFNAGVIHGKSAIQLRNFENIHVVFRPGSSDRVTTSCHTKSLDLGGTAPDHVEIPGLSCNNDNDLVIAVKGEVSIIDRKTRGSTTVQAGYDKRMKRCPPNSNSTIMPPLDLSLSYLGGGEMTLLLNFPIHKVSKAVPNQLDLEGGDRITLNGTFPNVFFEEDDDHKSALVKEGGGLMAFHELNSVGGVGAPMKVRRGAHPIPNIFKLVHGSNWKVTGGSREDTFSLVGGGNFTGNLDGGQGRNRLFMDDGIVGAVSIDLNGQVFIQGRKSVSFKNIGEVHGRTGEPDKIHVGCELNFVGMNGGRDASNYDTITIPQLSCDPNPKMAIVAPGYTEVVSRAVGGNFDIYVQVDPLKKMKFKADIIVRSSTVFNIPIHFPVQKLTSYDLRISKDGHHKMIHLRLDFFDNDNFVEFKLSYDMANYEALKPKSNMLFIDENFRSIGNILVDDATGELNILHVLQDGSNKDRERGNVRQTRNGATGAKNIFRLHSGNWEAFGGRLDDAFILNEAGFQGNIHGLGGTNSLILKDSIGARRIVINLAEKRMMVDNSPPILVNGIQTVDGRKGKEDTVVCACDTKLVMLEGGASSTAQDKIEVEESYRPPQISFVLEEFTEVDNRDLGGNFAYHVRTPKNFEIMYEPTMETKHAFKFEIPLEQVKSIAILEGRELRMKFKDWEHNFPLNFQNLPTFQIGTGAELLAELILKENEIPGCSIIGRSPFSGSIHGVNGAENGIIVQTSNALQSIMGGDKDDVIFLSEVQSIEVLDGGGGANRLQFEDELHKGEALKVDLSLGKITFLDEWSSIISPFAGEMKRVTLFTGREHSFEKVVLGCDTANVRFADEVVVRVNCSYDVRIEVGPAKTRMIFDIGEDPQEEHHDLEEPDDDDDEVEEESEEAESLEELDEFNDDDDPETDNEEEVIEEVDAEHKPAYKMLQPSTFYYHFTSLQTFDLEVDSFSRLRQTRHIFYLSFFLADLKSLRFSLEDSRLIYSTLLEQDQNDMEYSHLVGEAEPTSLFYSQPEFMTKEGFLLRVFRYGEIIAVISNPEEILEGKTIEQNFIPRLSAYSSQLGISFMLETGRDFIYCGNPNELGLLTNQDTVTSHLVGFNGTTYEILGLEQDVFIYPQSVVVEEDSVHVLDLTNIIFQIRNATGSKYVPEVNQVGEVDFEIRMTNWTGMFPGKVVIKDGIRFRGNLRIMLNSIAMEIVSADHESVSLEENENGGRGKRSTGEKSTWIIKPRPISIPEGHVYLLAAEDLEDGVKVVKGTAGNGNYTFEYSKRENDLVVSSISPEEIEMGEASSLIIFDYYAPAPTAPTVLLEVGVGGNETETSLEDGFGRVDRVNRIQIRSSNETVEVSSNGLLLVSSETGEGIEVVQFYEDILDREEYEILKEFPDIPRKFKVPLWRKIGRNPVYLYVFWGAFLFCTVLVGTLMFGFCRKRTERGKYSVVKRRYDGRDEFDDNGLELAPLNMDLADEYSEPKCIAKEDLTDQM